MPLPSSSGVLFVRRITKTRNDPSQQLLPETGRLSSGTQDTAAAEDRRMESLLLLLIGLTAALGCVALGLGGFVIGQPTAVPREGRPQ
jgi:hypothetical protein